jgi:SAM-dependent methyltransferase
VTSSPTTAASRTANGDYTPLSTHYDTIMTGGTTPYYDYPEIIGQVLHRCADITSRSIRSILEIGAGSGLILEGLAQARPDLQITGVDLTQAMLDIATVRLRPYRAVTLKQQDVVDLSLPQTYDLSFSYGGVWYFVHDSSGFRLVSHIRDDAANRRGLQRLGAHLPSGAILLLGIQGPHHDYARPVSHGLLYSQKIEVIPDGFRKHYSILSPSGDTLTLQTTDYRSWPFDEAASMLSQCGFEFHPSRSRPESVFLEFSKA